MMGSGEKPRQRYTRRSGPSWAGPISRTASETDNAPHGVTQAKQDALVADLGAWPQPVDSGHDAEALRSAVAQFERRPAMGDALVVQLRRDEMAYAPHNNDHVLYQLQCGQMPSDLPLILGQFREAEYGETFEFAERRWPDDTFAADMPHVVYVGGASAEPRLAKVLKTVAFVVVDEDADGQPVIERWEIRGCRAYDTAWVRA